MPRRRSPNLRISRPARRDIASILRWSVYQFGMAAALRYEALIAQALRDLLADPQRPGSRDRPDVMIDAVRTYHLLQSRGHVAGQQVKEPRHFIVYRSRPDGILEILRILHERTDLQRHLPDDSRSG